MYFCHDLESSFVDSIVQNGISNWMLSPQAKEGHTSLQVSRFQQFQEVHVRNLLFKATHLLARLFQCRNAFCRMMLTKNFNLHSRG